MGSKIRLNEPVVEEQVSAYNPRRKKENTRNQYREDFRIRKGMEPRSKKLVHLAIAAVVVFLVILFVPMPIKHSFDFLFSIHYTMPEYVGVFKENILNIGYILSGQADTLNLDYWQRLSMTTKQTDILESITAFVVGAGLGVVGAVFQGSFRNSIASPTTLGVMSGGTLGSTVYIMWGTAWYASLKGVEYTGNEGFFQAPMILFVFVGCLGAVLFTTSVAKLVSGKKKISMVSLIVVGMIFSSAVSTISQYISMTVNMTNPYGLQAALLQIAMQGRINSDVTWQLALVIGVILLVIHLQAKRLNLLVFGEDEARAMGINVERTRRSLMLLCTVLTAVVISTCGGISFLGLIIPHIARRVVGSDFRYLIPGCTIIGGIFLMFCNWLPPFTGMPMYCVGTYTSIIGGILFLFIIIRGRRKQNADWA